ncbi:MAG: GntR family transcriptional regulator, partial [Actinomycetota bacterium]|nr:GntR family transcriptional regulator [Actinomycetota bacterium]
AGVQPEPQPGARDADPAAPRKALSPRDRALTVAHLHVSRHGALPSVRELQSQAHVSRGTAHTAIQALRAQANGLHVVTETPDERPEP